MGRVSAFGTRTAPGGGRHPYLEPDPNPYVPIGSTTDPDESATDPDESATEPVVQRLRLLDALAQGTVGGLLATVVMTTYRLPIARSLPPTAAFWARYVRAGDAADYPGIGLLLHLGYGAGAGAVFGVLFRIAGLDARPGHVREARGVSLATIYGVALSVFGSRVVLGRLLGMDLDADEALVFHVSHMIYALTLGTWVGSRVGSDATK